MNLVRGGPAQAAGWFKAKFINQPWKPLGDTSGVGTPPGKAPGAYRGHTPGLGRKKG